MGIVTLRCPDCAEKFRWPSQDKWPEFCPYCRADVASNPDNEIAAPMILTAKGKSSDQVYRAMERGSEHRAQVAAEMTGQPVSEFNDLKVTNLKSNLREGDTADMGISPDNVVHQAVQQQGGMVMPNTAGRDALIAQSASVSQGKFANAGARMQNIVREAHQKYVPHGASSIPALETTSPGYRKRVN